MGLTQYLKNKYLLYEGVTVTYMLDPWEKVIFNLVFFSILYIFTYYTFKVSRPVVELLIGPDFWTDLYQFLKVSSPVIDQPLFWMDIAD